MKTSPHPSTALRHSRGFTLLEALVVSGTLVFIIGSVIMCNLFGLAMSDRQEIWIGASEDAANVIGLVMSDVRSANSLQVGTYAGSTFTQTGSTNTQSGSALLVYPTTNSYPWVLYYYDATSNNLVRTNYNGPSVPGDFKLVSANPITNDATHAIFTEVDYTGAPLTAPTTIAPISIYLSFTRLQNPQIVIENGSLVDLYTITAVVAPRLHL
jgi:type II secretory pathway pseudopilin PulG